MGTPLFFFFFFFFAILTAFVTSRLLLWRMKLFQKKSTLKGKNSVLSELILRGAYSFLKQLTHNELKVQMKIKELFVSPDSVPSHLKINMCTDFQIQSTLVISKSKGPSKTVRDIRTSTYQICSIEEKTI